MKKILSLLLVLTLVLGATSLTACQVLDEVLGSLGYTKTQPEPELPKYSEGLDLKLNVTAKSLTVYGIGECTDVDVIIPEEVDGIPVTAIAKKAFYENDKIKSVVIPESVISIGDEAFYKCTSLESVNLPVELFELGDAVFTYCTALKEIVIPKTITEIPAMSFSFCSSLEKIELHDNIESFGDNCFSGCISLKELFIPKSITLDNFTEFYMFLNSLEAFKVSEDNPDFYEVDGNLYLDILGTKCFMSYAMGKTEEEFTVPSEVEMIYPIAFNFLPWDYEDFQNMIAPDFKNCKYQSNLKKVTISEGVSSIMMMAFMFCTELETVSIPSSMAEIWPAAFMYCPKLETIEYDGTVEEWRAIEKDEGWATECPNLKEVVCIDGIVDPYEVPEEIEKEVITLWVSTTEGVKEFTQEQIDEFMAAHPEYSGYEIKIERVSEGDAAYEILRNPDAAPDMYCFAQDQLNPLVAAGMLAPLDSYTLKTVKTANDVGSVNAATFDGLLYAYPMTSDNGIFLYYDSRYVSDEEAKTVEGILAACERNNKKFGYQLTNAWIMAGFFFAQPVGTGTPLCVSEWEYSYDTRSFTGVNDTFNSENGLIAAKAIKSLANSSAWVDAADNFAGTAAVVTGIWNIYSAEAEYGEYVKAAKLPTYTVDGNEYQLGSYAGYKLLGVKPQEDPMKEAFCTELAIYLSGEECQLERYYEFGWGPSNVNAQANEDVQSNVYLSALIEQNIYAQPQETIPGDWWSYAAVLPLQFKDAANDDELRKALEEYQTRIDYILSRQ